MSRRLLVVGFGPFPRVPINPSGRLAEAIAAAPRLRRLGVATRSLVMRTAYAAIAEQLEPALDESPDAVVMIGVATRAKRVRVELQARNRASRLFPDASGRQPRGLALDPAGPATRISRDASRIVVRLRRHGIDAAGSRDAGRYLCNASYYRALAGDRPTVFLHIPEVPDPHKPRENRLPRRTQPFAQWANAFADAALVLLRSARAQGVGTSSVRRSTESR